MWGNLTFYKFDFTHYYMFKIDNVLVVQLDNTTWLHVLYLSNCQWSVLWLLCCGNSQD